MPGFRQGREGIAGVIHDAAPRLPFSAFQRARVAASTCDTPAIKATSEIGSPPLSPVAKSAQRPVILLTRERTEAPISAPGIERDKLAADRLAVWQEPIQNGREGCQRRLIDRGEVEGFGQMNLLPRLASVTMARATGRARR